MVSTVNAATVAAITDPIVFGSLTVISVLALIGLLIQKELTTGSDGQFARPLGIVLNVAIVPILTGFILIVAVRIAQILR